MVSKFFEVLPILMDGDRQVGVCAMGPIGDRDVILWMRVWIWQQDGEEIAASAGNAGDQVPGAHPLNEDTRPPFAHPNERWMVQTKLEPVSADFTVEKSALVQAIALVENGGHSSIMQWSQAVGLRVPVHQGAGNGQGSAHEHQHDH